MGEQYQRPQNNARLSPFPLLRSENKNRLRPPKGAYSGPDVRVRAVPSGHRPPPTAMPKAEPLQERGRYHLAYFLCFFRFSTATQAPMPEGPGPSQAFFRTGGPRTPKAGREPAAPPHPPPGRDTGPPIGRPPPPVVAKTYLGHSITRAEAGKGVDRPIGAGYEPRNLVRGQGLA